MVISFEYKPLAELTAKVGSGATPRGGKDSYKKSGISLIRSLNIYNYQFKNKDLAFIDENQAAKLRNVIVKKNDILLNITGASVCRCSIVPDYILPARVNQHVTIVRTNPELLIPQFALYAINSSSLKRGLFNLAMTGATREALTKNDILGYKLPVPTIQIQKKIAAILSVYDDLIENNKRRITILENMAEEIYREWFVRFRFPGYKKAEFEKGIPKGWELKKFSDFCLLKRGYDLPDAQVVAGDYPVIASTSIKTHHQHYKAEPPVITTGRSGSLGTVLFNMKRSWPLNTSLYVKDFKGNSPYFIYFTLKNMKLENFNSGAGVPSLNRNHLSALKLYVPDVKFQDEFELLIDPIFKQNDILAKEINNLEESRNELLPRLISGKHSVESFKIQFPPSMQAV